MVKYRVDYEDGSYALIKCPECNSEDISHEHDEERPLDMVCTSCRLRFELEETERKIIQVTTEGATRESPAIIPGRKAESQKEYKATTKRLRKEINE